MSWAVVYTKKNDPEKTEYLELFTYSKERAEKLAQDFNSKIVDKNYEAKLCETF